MYQEFTRSTAVYPKQDLRAIISYLALGLNGEAGEVAEKVKKWIRDGSLDKDGVEKEIGDVFWYLTRLADELNLSLDVILTKNRDKLIDRQNRGMLRGSGDNR